MRRSEGRAMHRALLEVRGSAVYLLSHTVILLLGLVLTLTGAPFLSAVGPSVAAVGIVGYVTYLYIRQDEKASRRLDAISRMGLEDALDGRGVTNRAEYD